MTDRLVFTITLGLRSPFLFRGLDGGVLGVDAAQLRDERNRPIIPADQMRGVFREALGDLAAVGAGITTPDIAALFGDPSQKEDDANSSNDPNRGAIVFSDLTAEAALASSGETTRIEIDDNTGAVKDGQLLVLELVAPFGEVVAFTGTVVVFRPRQQRKPIEDLLRKALGLMSAIGAFKSPGFGEVVPDRSCVKFKSETSLALRPSRRSWPDDMKLRVRFDRPVLVDAERIADNAFLGRSIIPGGVFKGALADRLLRAGLKPGEGALGTALAALAISHAFPESDTPGQPWGLPLPLSLVAISTDDGLCYGDALGVPANRGAMIKGEPARFLGDWKDAWYGGAHQALERPRGEEPPGLSRTHTRIDPDTGTAKDEALFTFIARSVVKADGSPRTWLLDIDLGRVADREKAGQLITVLDEDGLDQIGKTGAHASFEWVPDQPRPEPRPIDGEQNRFAVVLTTPALMLDPMALCDAAGRWIRDAEAAYRSYWQEALPGATLHNFYATQRFTGGYLARRRRLYGDDRYFPFLLTEAGSVFEIETRDWATLTALCRHGLPVPTIGGTVPSWRNCPYMPENGYGRITADHLSQADLRKVVQHV